MEIRAQLQGVAYDYSHANGSYDAVDLGPLTPEGLAAVLAAMTRLEPPPDGEDVCWPNLAVNGPGGETWFSIAEAGRLVGEDGEASVDIADAVARVTGEPYSGVIPAHRRAAAPAAPPPGTKVPSGSGAAGPKLDEKARELVLLLENPVRLSDYRARFPYLMNGPSDPEFRRLAEQIEGSDLMPELKARLQNYPPRVWGLQSPGLFRRFLSFVIDIPLFIILIFIGMAVVIAVFTGENSMPIAALTWFLIAFLGYFVATERYLSASPGGLIMGIRVVNDWGGTPSFGTCLKRQFTRFFRIVLMILAANYSANRQFTSSKMAGGAMVAQIGSGGGGEVVRA